jgi:hypothetical protein
MKSDLYTKFVLTAIALSLSVIAIQLTTKDANAQSGAKFSPSGALIVTICDPDKTIARSKYDFDQIQTCAHVPTKAVQVTPPAKY